MARAEEKLGLVPGLSVGIGSSSDASSDEESESDEVDEASLSDAVVEEVLACVVAGFGSLGAFELLLLRRARFTGGEAVVESSMLWSSVCAMVVDM